MGTNANPDVVCTDTSLTFRVPLADLPAPLRGAIVQWLLAHHVDPDHVAVGYASSEIGSEAR